MPSSSLILARFSDCLAYFAGWQLRLLRSLGARLDEAPSNARAELVWTHFPASWGVFVMIGLVAAAAYAIASLYRRELSSCPTWMKTLLTVLRCVTMLLIACILLGPATVLVESRTLEPTIVIARDESRSMSTADASMEGSVATRAAVVNSLLSDNSRLLDSLTRKGQLEVLDFADQPHLVELARPRDTPLSPLQPTQGGTNLAAVIEEGLKAERPAAIVLFTDGQHTAKDDVSEAARKAKLRGIRIFAIGIGDPNRPKSERVSKLISRPQAWQDEPFEIEALITFQGAEAGDRRIELFEEQLSDNNQRDTGGKLVATTEVVVPEGGTGQATVHFTRTVNEPGRYVYRAGLADSLSKQSDLDNVVVSDIVKVLSRESIRVLLVAGSPTWDYRLVQTLLSRDKTMRVSCWLQSLDAGRGQEGSQPIDDLPQTKSELFEYDVILLFDPNPDGLDRDWIELVGQFVGEHSGGLLFMAGPKFTSQLLASSRTNELTRLLPVKFGDLAALAVESLVASSDAAYPLAVVPANADHPVLRFFPDREETIRRWQTLPGVLWSFPASEAAPAAQVLLQHGERALGGNGNMRPLLVAGRYGAGNTMYLGLDSTWRWRSAGRQAEFFDKFWIQTVRFLAEGRALEGRRRGYVQSDREHYEIGQRINVSARLLNAAFEPLVLPKMQATVEQPGTPPEALPLLRIANQPGRYEAAITARQAGTGTIRVQLPDTTSESGLLMATFTVEVPSLETNQTWLNRPLLEQLAKQTGGRYFEVSEVDQLAAAVPNRVERVEERSEPRPLWDVPGMLVVLVGLLSTEWLLRRRFSLL